MSLLSLLNYLGGFLFKEGRGKSHHPATCARGELQKSRRKLAVGFFASCLANSFGPAAGAARFCSLLLLHMEHPPIPTCPCPFSIFTLSPSFSLSCSDSVLTLLPLPWVEFGVLTVPACKQGLWL